MILGSGLNIKNVQAVVSKHFEILPKIKGGENLIGNPARIYLGKFMILIYYPNICSTDCVRLHDFPNFNTQEVIKLRSYCLCRYTFLEPTNSLPAWF